MFLFPSALSVSRSFRVVSFIVVSIGLFACTSSTVTPSPAFAASAFASVGVNASPSLPSKQVEMLLWAHNKIRVRHNLQVLGWSNRLAYYAQVWANELRRRNCPMTHRPNHGPFKQKHGENLFWASSVLWSDGVEYAQPLKPKGIVDDWASEREFYDYRSNSCMPGEMCGHYTQIVWRETTEVGCAMAMCPNKEQVWVCNYDPPGNYVGEKPF